jgi:signal transduction histidine kinase
VRRSTLRRRLAVTFATLAALVVLGVTLAVVVSLRLVSAQDRVVETIFNGASASADLSQALVDQETGFRGFALTGDEQFLQPYTDGVKRAERSLARMAEPEQEFPSLRERRVAVERASDDWRVSVVEPGIAAVRAGGMPDDAELRESKQRFDAVRAAIEDYRAQLLDLRTDNVAELKQDVVWLFVVLASAMVLLLAMAGLAWVALRRWVTDPLAHLGAEVDRVEAGDLSRRVSVDEAPEEIRVLAEQVESMRVRILHEFALAEQSRAEALEARALVEEQAEDLRRSNAELEQFAYVASHDLQEPLRKVASFCQLIERRYKGQLDERGEQYIEFAVDGAKRMQQLINDLLAFSRVGRVTNDFTTVDLEHVLAQALRQLDATLEEAGAVVTHDPLPTLRGDASLLVQLLQNLIGNGVKFRSDQPPRVHIGVRRAPGDDGLWEFSCSDNGIGIDAQYQDKIFVIFQRLHGRDTYGGTGIGLAMCKKIVEHHGGRLWLDSEAGGGSTGGATFRWTLPVDNAVDREAPGAQRAVTPGPAGLTGTDTDGRTAHDAAAGAAGRDLARGGRPG